MNRLLSLCLVTAIIAGSCAKKSIDDVEPVAPPVVESEKVYSVKFNTNDFRQAVSEMSKTSTLPRASTNATEDDPVSLRMLIYKDGTLITSRDQQSHFGTAPAATFGVFDDIKLVKGVYSIAFVATNAWYVDSPPGALGNRPLNNINYLSFSRINSTLNRSIIPSNIQLYVNNFKSFTVERDSSYAPVYLDRKHSQINIKSTSAIPSSVAQILIGTQQKEVAYPFQLNQSTLFNEAHHVQYSVTDKAGRSNEVFSLNIIPYNQNVNLEVLFFDRNNSLILSKVINNVSVKENHITDLEGSLFADFDPESGNNSTDQTVRAFLNRDFNSERIKMTF